MKKKSYFKLLISLFLILSLVAGIFLVQKAVLYFSGASGTPANLVIDLATSYGEQSDTWRNLAQGGEDKGRMLLPVIPLVKALKPQYIRIDHVFDYYDQAMLDSVIGDITATGAIPFISLSYMPLNISKSGDITDIPKNWSDWELRVQKLIEHISGKNGLALSNVYYEVWNEPDLFGNFKISGSNSYLDLYLHSALGAGRAQNTISFKFGGPAVTAYYPNWMSGLIDFTSKNNLRLDFLSWHKYTKNISDFETDTASARGLLAKYNKPNMELIISETGPNSSNDGVYDTDIGAIHLLATTTVLQGEVGKVFAFEVKDGAGPSQYWGRWGILTNEKFGTPLPKPRYKAFQFLNSLIGGTKLQVYGQGSWVRSFAKKISPNLFRILVVNYDPRGVHNEIVPITLANLSFSNFTVKRIDFLGRVINQEVATTSATWATSAYFKPNSAAVFEVIAK